MEGTHWHPRPPSPSVVPLLFKSWSFDILQKKKLHNPWSFETHACQPSVPLQEAAIDQNGEHDLWPDLCSETPTILESNKWHHMPLERCLGTRVPQEWTWWHLQNIHQKLRQTSRSCLLSGGSTSWASIKWQPESPHHATLLHGIVYVRSSLVCIWYCLNICIISNYQNYIGKNMVTLHVYDTHDR